MGQWGSIAKPNGDVGITDDQAKMVRSLQEQIDGRPRGTYADHAYTMTRAEASRYIDVLKAQLDRRRVSVSR